MPDARTLTIPRTARYFVAGEPGPSLREAWIVLHGYGQLADAFLADFEPFVAPGRAFLAPEGLSRFYLKNGGGPIGASWMTKVSRDDEIDDYVRFLDAVHGHALGLPPGAKGAVRVVVLGFSQGSATALRWALRGRVAIDRVIAWGGGVPPDVDLARERARLESLDLTLVAGTRDAYIDERRLEAETSRLHAARVPHRVVRFDGGHRLDRETLARLIV